MKVTVKRALLAQALNRAMIVVANKADKNILSHVLISVDDDMVSVVSNNYDVGVIEVFRSTKTTTDGHACVVAASLSQIVSALEDEEVQLQGLANNWLKISAGGSSYKLAGSDHDDFAIPALIEDDEDEQYSDWISGADLAQAVDAVGFAISKDPSRVALCNMLMHVSNDKISFVAADQSRCAQFDVPRDEVSDPVGDCKFLLSPRARDLLVGFRGVESVSVDGNSSILRFSDEDADHSLSVFVRLTDSEFPDYTKFVTEDLTRSGIEFQVDQSALIKALNRIAIVVGDNTKVVTIAFHEDRLEIEAKAPQLSEGTEIVIATPSAPFEKFSILYNLSYLREAVSRLPARTPGEGVTLLATAAKTSRTVISRDSIADQSLAHQYVLVPLRAE